jgi:hypothetical protein
MFFKAAMKYASGAELEESLEEDIGGVQAFWVNRHTSKIVNCPDNHMMCVIKGQLRGVSKPDPDNWKADKLQQAYDAGWVRGALDLRAGTWAFAYNERLGVDRIKDYMVSYMVHKRIPVKKYLDKTWTVHHDVDRPETGGKVPVSRRLVSKDLQWRLSTSRIRGGETFTVRLDEEVEE